MNHTSVITYSDYKNRQVSLTEDQLAWFNGIVKTAIAATECPVEIIPYDHERYEKQHREALGCCISTNPENPLAPNADTYITIDCYYINEAWDCEFNDGFLFGDDPLRKVIAHEIAHLYVWRHGKKHTALTEKLYQQILDYEASATKVA